MLSQQIEALTVLEESGSVFVHFFQVKQVIWLHKNLCFMFFGQCFIIENVYLDEVSLN